MGRYLVRRVRNGYHYVTVPPNVNIEESHLGFRFKGPFKITKWYKGYLLVRGDTPYKAFKKIGGKK